MLSSLCARQVRAPYCNVWRQLNTANMATVYPVTKKVEAGDTYHGVRIADPFRWLEEPDNEETKAWVDQQNDIFNQYRLAELGKRDAIRRCHEMRYNYARMSSPMVKGDRTFVYRNTGLQNQDVLWDITLSKGQTDEALFGSGKALVDLNSQFPEGTVALSSTSFSEDGKFFAYALSRGGSDWVTVYIRDVQTGQDLPDAIPWVKFTRIAWLHDASGFFYCRYPAPPEVKDAEGGKAGTETGANRYAMVCFHEVGTPASQDLLVYANIAKPNWRYGVEVSDDGQYLMLSTVKGTDPVNRLYYAHLPSCWATWKDGKAQPCDLAPGGVPPPQPKEEAADKGFLPFIRAFDSFDGEMEYLTNDGQRFYLKTNLGAPRYRIVATDFPAAAVPGPFICAGEGAPAEGAAVDIDAPRGSMAPIADVVPQHDKDVLDWATVSAGRHLVTCYLRDVCSALTVRLLPDVYPEMPIAATPTGDSGVKDLLLIAATDVPLPAPGTVASWSGRRDHDSAWFKFVSFLHPGSVMQIKFEGEGLASKHVAVRAVTAPVTAVAAAGSPTAVSFSSTPCAKITPYWNAHVPNFDATRFHARQVFVPSKDGKVQIPMFIVRKVAPGENPMAAPAEPKSALLYFYGGFSISLGPNYSSLRTTWLEECEGVWALANIRGGNEYGEEWHAGGSKHNKTNCFDDAAACGEWLVANGYTIPRKCGIMGGSNGGLGVLATAQRYPSHFGAVVSQVPVTDMMRFHKFTIGAAWRGEYGFAEDSEADFQYMMAYSPLHNVRPAESEERELPSILITTADHDDRVVPLHSHKMTATLQAIAGASPFQKRPLMTRIETQAGHGAGKPTGKVLDEYADVYAFLARELGAEVKA